MSHYYGTNFRNICVRTEHSGAPTLKKEFSLLCTFLKSYVYFDVDVVIYSLRTVPAYIRGTQLFQVYIVLIVVTPVQPLLKAKGNCGSSEGTVREFLR